MRDPLASVFKKNTKTTHNADGTITIACRLRLWRVSGRAIDEVMREARHYFIQYYEDGEYDDS